MAAIFEMRYPEYQYRVVQFLIEHLSDVSRAFRGDLQAAIVLAVIGQVYLGARRSRDRSVVGHETLRAERIGTSATRIADVTDIPRQTVRRKLSILESRGWVVRNDDCTYRLAVEEGQSAAKQDLHDTDARTLRRVARLFTDLERIVDSHEADAAGVRSLPNDADSYNRRRHRSLAR